MLRGVPTQKWTLKIMKEVRVHALMINTTAAESESWVLGL